MKQVYLSVIAVITPDDNDEDVTVTKQKFQQALQFSTAAEALGCAIGSHVDLYYGSDWLNDVIASGGDAGDAAPAEWVGTAGTELTTLLEDKAEEGETNE